MLLVRFISNSNPLLFHELWQYLKQIQEWLFSPFISFWGSIYFTIPKNLISTAYTGFRDKRRIKEFLLFPYESLLLLNFCRWITSLILMFIIVCFTLIWSCCHLDQDIKFMITSCISMYFAYFAAIALFTINSLLHQS